MSALPVTCVPAFDDNYLWLLHGVDPRHVAVVDPGDAARIAQVLQAEHLHLDAILVTHHHRDHTGGVQALADAYGCPVYGPASETIPARTQALVAGDLVALPTLGRHFTVLDCPGHTAGHIAYAGHGALFCGDTLFSGGCGRLFEGTAAQMLHSLGQFAALPGDTAVYCAHEYTAANLRFALAVEPGNPDLVAYAAEVTRLRAAGLATVPTTIARERAINPFLRTQLPSVYASVWQEAEVAHAAPDETFRLLREWKNRFR